MVTVSTIKKGSTPNTTKTVEKTVDKILNLIKNDPSITQFGIEKATGLSRRVLSGILTN